MIVKLRDNEKNARENKTPEHKLEYWRQWRKNNPEKVKAAQEKFNLDKARRNAIAKKYRENNPEAVALAKKKYKQSHPDEGKNYAKKWRAENPEKDRVCRQNRRKLEFNAEGSFSAVDIRAIFIAQKSKCAVCRKSIKKKYHLDHIIALVNGGTNWPKNLQLLCPPCNLAKGKKDPMEFMRGLGRLL